MGTVGVFRVYAPDLRDKLVTLRAQNCLIDRREQFGPVRSACRDFGVWARSGATPRQCVRQAINTFRALA